MLLTQQNDKFVCWVEFYDTFFDKFIMGWSQLLDNLSKVKSKL